MYQQSVSVFSKMIEDFSTAFLVSFCRVYLFRIPLLKYLLSYTTLGNISIGIVMIVSNTLTAVLSTAIAIYIILKERRKYE